MLIAVEGCCHGELDKIYETLQERERREGIQIELLLCCGDFQSVRDEADLHCMAVPDKYKSMQDFWQYYNGTKKAPYLTIFIGGNHEASNHLQELPYGGWVAPNIYYLGYAGVVRYKGLRIGGISGIFKGHDYHKTHFEKPPYDNNTKRSVYHVRSIDVFRLKQIQSGIDIMMSHDWPNGIVWHGNVDQLLRKKRYFEQDVRNNRLGSKPSWELLTQLRPKHWFSGHLHVKFTASVQHEVPEDSANKNNNTQFLALDKCLPKREFLQIINIQTDEQDSDQGLSYDPEWLAILRSTNDLVSVSRRPVFLPRLTDSVMSKYVITKQSIEETTKLMDQTLTIPNNFNCEIAPLYNPQMPNRFKPVQCRTNSQTTEFCAKLEINDPLMMAMVADGMNVSFNSSLFLEEDSEMPSTIVSSTSINADEIDLGSDSDDDTPAKEAVVSAEDEAIGLTESEEDMAGSAKLEKYDNKNDSVTVSSLSSDDEIISKPTSMTGGKGLMRSSLNLPAPTFGATSTPVRQMGESKVDDFREFSPMNVSTDSDHIPNTPADEPAPVTTARSRNSDKPLAKNALLVSLRGKRVSDTESDMSESGSGKESVVPRKFKRRNASLYTSQSEDDTT